MSPEVLSKVGVQRSTSEETFPDASLWFCSAKPESKPTMVLPKTGMEYGKAAYSAGPLKL